MANGPRIYQIIRFREDCANRVVSENVTLQEAQAHCSDPATRGVDAGVRWFDGYDLMPGESGEMGFEEEKEDESLPLTPPFVP